jgi:hypothetical protein
MNETSPILPHWCIDRVALYPDTQTLTIAFFVLFSLSLQLEMALDVAPSRTLPTLFVSHNPFSLLLQIDTCLLYFIYFFSILVVKR